MAVSDLIRGSLHNPVIRAYIKRRLVSGSYESNWQRVDLVDGADAVKDWGSTSLQIDADPSNDVASFEIGDMTLIFKNETGFWNVETDSRSFFYPYSTYLNRKNTKIKIDAGYLDSDGNEVGVVTVFEGLINRVVVSENNTAQLTALSYLSVVDAYPISDLALSGSMVVSDVIDAIMNQSKITDFIPFVASVPALDSTITDAAELSGSYWDVIKYLALRSLSVPMLVGSTWSFTERTPSVSSVWDFMGQGTNTPDILSVTAYDDEGADRVRLRWESQDAVYSSESTNSLLKLKYLLKPETVDLANFNPSNSGAILDGLLAYWENPKPNITFTAPFLLNQIKPLDKITLTVRGRPLGDGTTIFDTFYFDDGSLLDDYAGSINIFDQTPFMVTSVTKNVDDWVTEIRAERIGS